MAKTLYVASHWTIPFSSQRQAMYITWNIGFPSGDEKGDFLTIDLGGTNLRICWISLRGKGNDIDIRQDQYELPDDIKTAKAEKLWTFIAESLKTFIEREKLNGTEENPLKLGFTFSYPAIQDSIDHGVLQTWTKGFEIDDVEGNDVASQLRDAIARFKLPIKLIALINDTTGAMIASAYTDPDTMIGAIFGTGCNAAYMENVGDIPKLEATNGLVPETPMAINCEYGAFDNAHHVLPLTKYDETIDSESPKPGEQAFEKMSAGLYLGEIYRLVMLDLHKEGLIFKGQDVSRLMEPYSLDTGFLSGVENDKSPKLQESAEKFKKDLRLDVNEQELQLSRRIAESIAVRGARLCACGVAAICHKKNIKKGHVAADGSVANKHPKFKKRWGRALGEILGWPSNRKEDPIILTTAEDGSGVGAAVIAAMTLARAKEGQKAGIKEV